MGGDSDGDHDRIDTECVLPRDSVLGDKENESPKCPRSEKLPNKVVQQRSKPTFGWKGRTVTPRKSSESSRCIKPSIAIPVGDESDSDNDPHRSRTEPLLPRPSMLGDNEKESPKYPRSED